MNVRNDGDRWRCTAHHWAPAFKFSPWDELKPGHVPVRTGAEFEIVQVLPDGFVLFPVRGRRELLVVSRENLFTRFEYSALDQYRRQRDPNGVV